MELNAAGVSQPHNSDQHPISPLKIIEAIPRILVKRNEELITKRKNVDSD